MNDSNNNHSNQIEFLETEEPQERVINDEAPDCEVCGGTGILKNVNSDGWQPKEQEVILIQRCDHCARYADDFEAARAYGQPRGVICIRKPEDRDEQPDQEQPGFVPCTFVTRWGGETEIETEGRFNPTTLEVISLESAEDDGELENLEDEYIVLEDGDELPVCMNCHTHVMKNIEVPNTPDSNLVHEEAVCPHCDEGND